VTPEVFDGYAEEARALGFAFVASGPLVRSSYHAAEGFVAARLRPAPAPGSDASAALLVDGPAPTQLIRASSLVRRSSGVSG